MKYIKHIIHKMTSSVKLTLFRIRWIKLNKHNLTRARRIFDINKVSVGMNTYGSLDVKDFGNPSEALKIGNYCSIAEGVKFLLGGEHHCKTVSQYPFNLYISSADQQLDRITKGPIVIDDDVWIGTNAIILSGVHIGQGAVIGAGSVVAKDVPPYAVFAGGRVVKYRFAKEMIDKLLLFDYGKLTNQDVKENRDLLYKNLDEAFFESKLYKKCRRDV